MMFASRLATISTGAWARQIINSSTTRYMLTSVVIVNEHWQHSGKIRHHNCRQVCTSAALQSKTEEPSLPVEQNEKPSIMAGTWPHILSKKAIEAPDGFNRLLAVPSSFLVQLSIGSVYAFSMWNAPWSRELGVVTASSADWTLQELMPVFSVSAIALALTTAILGPWVERAGPRYSATLAAITYGSAFAVSSVALAQHDIALLYLGYGVLGGIGWGFGYISPVSTLMRWFPDRRGLATGLALAMFGGGASIAAPVIQNLCDVYFIAPDYLGTVAQTDLTTVSGKLFANVGNEVKEVVVATAADVAACPGGLDEGVYVVGTGSTGAKKALLTLSGVYGTAMLAGAYGNRVPKEGWSPAGWTPPSEEESGKNALITRNNVHHNTALKTPQFYLIWTAVMGNAVAGMAILSSAKTMMGDVFGAGLPALVTGAFATSYVSALSLANAAGRLGWSTASDYMGRKNTYYLFATGIPVAATIPFLTESFSENPNAAVLYAFYFGTMGMVSFYGGTFSALPAYLADVFGQKHVGAIHGRLLTAWAGSALLGPNLLAYFRKSSFDTAIEDLMLKIPADSFERAFNAPVSELQNLLDAKTVTIPRLLELMPPNTLDPTPLLYNTTMYGICGMLTVALAANYMISPVNTKYHLKEGLPISKPAPK